MCLIVFAINAHPEYKLVLAANRDEFYERPTLAADYWSDHPQILGGRDKKAGGTWMAMHTSGRFAAVTNYRDLKNIRADAKSRGALPTDYLLTDQTSAGYLSQVREAGQAYNGFNLLVFDGKTIAHLSNYENEINEKEEGVYGLSNALLDTPWPKVEKLKEEFRSIIKSDFRHADLLSILADKSLAADEALPDTGVGYDREKMLSAICIRSANYGTCCSTVVTITHDNQVSYTEHSYPVGLREEGTVSFNFRV